MGINELANINMRTRKEKEKKDKKGGTEDKEGNEGTVSVDNENLNGARGGRKKGEGDGAEVQLRLKRQSALEGNRLMGGD